MAPQGPCRSRPCRFHARWSERRPPGLCRCCGVEFPASGEALVRRWTLDRRRTGSPRHRRARTTPAARQRTAVHPEYPRRHAHATTPRSDQQAKSASVGCEARRPAAGHSGRVRCGRLLYSLLYGPLAPHSLSRFWPSRSQVGSRWIRCGRGSHHAGDGRRRGPSCRPSRPHASDRRSAGGNSPDVGVAGSPTSTAT